jgi:hypothetical protein
MIHAAAAVAHGEERQAMGVFVLIAVCQVAWGVLVLGGVGRSLRLVGAFGNFAVIGGWIAAKTVGVSFVDGLEAAEGVQLADGLAATLAASVVVLQVAAEFHGGGALRRAIALPAMAGTFALAVAVAAAVGMEATTDHAHGHGHGDHAHASQPFDPDEPIDLGGVAG